MSHRSQSEILAVLALAAILSFRMLGLFMIYPVMTLYAGQYHYATPTLVGLALGAYGLTQAFLQLPASVLSDRIGRKPIILGGLLLFLSGSIIAASTHNIYFMIIGRALQGAGAIGSTIMAFAADLTRVENRTKAMALLGMTIGLSFALAMVLGPIITNYLQLQGVYWLTALSAVIGIIILFWLPEPKKLISQHKELHSLGTLNNLLWQPNLMPLNISILLLHAVLTANFMVIPLLCKKLQLLPADQWHLYLPVLFGSFIVVMPFIMLAEKKNKFKSALLLGILALLSAEALLLKDSQTYLSLTVSLLIFFSGFTLLEALLPSLISKLAPAHQKGTAMGIYSSLQFLGIFLGGWLAGLCQNYLPINAILLFCSIISLIWLGIISVMNNPPPLKTKVIPLKTTLTQQKAQKIIKQLLNLPGVVDVQICIEDCIAYLKVDHKIFNQTDLENTELLAAI